ncbi:intercellular adhesion molecule 5 [Triplophysa dalaica]|uniref:intercellular adhesion molecule 5 n=1 Tax=Triplophysa dalaica TaxID=1582913 RepID=UPI0024DFF603|nr:intercellular adhesion molecule 5 [Triplophysa dalaica]
MPHQGLRWEGFNTEINTTEDKSSWTVEEMTDWEIQPSCVVISNETQCSQDLTITIYKTPDRVSMSTGDDIMTEGSTYELHCDVVNVAPVQNLIVKWYKGETLMHNETFTDPIKTPVNKTSILQITPDRSDDGVQYRCEAELELGAAGHQPPPTVTSEPIQHHCIDECTLLQFNPQQVIVKYGSSVSVDCSTNITHNGMGWEASEGSVSMTKTQNLITWRVPSLTRWDILPQCYISTNMTNCVSLLPVLIYKTPDTVSMSTGDNIMTEGSTYELHCDVVNVAPVQNLIVKWYKGETLMHNETFTDPIKTPVNKTSILQITPDRSDDGVQYRCEAELELGAEGPQPPPTVTSEPLNITVYSIDECTLLQFNPQQVVVKYGSSVSVDCSTNITHNGIGWEASEGSVSMTKTQNLITWRVPSLTRWDILPQCYISTNMTNCVSLLPVLIYKTPDTVSIRKEVDKMTERYTYNLQCDVVNVAPVQYLIVKWYKGETLMHNETFTDPIKTPVNKTSILQITPDRSDDGVQYRCEAELELGAEGPQPPPTVTSERLNITVQSLLHFNPQRVVVKYGSSVSVDCSTHVAHSGIGWEASVGSVPMKRNQNLITWRVANLTRWDITAMCYMNYDRKQLENPLPVTVYKTPDRVSINTADHTGPMTEGFTYNLQCDVVNVAPVQNLTVKWYKGETLMHNETFTDPIKTPVNKTSILQITPDRSDDGVQYRCEAELELGAEGPQPPPAVTSEHINITVYYKPHIVFCYDWAPKIHSTLSSYPTSYFLISANPLPSISWSRGSSSLNASTFLDKYDSGEYKITASNKQGESSCIINITVEYPPGLNCTESFQIKEKTLFKPPCSVDGAPKPDISLYKNGKQIPFPYYPSRNESALYNLNASNTYGSVHHPLQIDILYAPVFDPMNEKIEVEADRNITLNCSSSGNPEPQVWWSFKNKNISTGGRYVSINIQKATSSNSGEYICSATNRVGHSRKIVSVEIKENISSSPSFKLYIYIFLFVLIMIIILCLYMLRKRKSTGEYQIQTDHELKPLSKGGLE